MLALSRNRIAVHNPHPLTEVIGAVRLGPVAFELRRGLVATLDAARKAPQAQLIDAFKAVMEVETLPPRLNDDALELVVLAAVQVAFYEETAGAVPASCQRTLAKAKEAAR